MPGLMLVLLLGAVLAVGPVRGEEGDCPEFECPAKVNYNKFEPILRYVIVRVSSNSKSSQASSL
jgi:hypothetical protein